MKVMTAVAAAARLGWNFRFETRLVAVGPVMGGTLKGDAPSYVTRQADADLYEGLAAGQFCYLLTLITTLRTSSLES